MHSPLLALLAACESDRTFEAVLTPIAADDADSVAVAQSVGRGLVEVPVRTVNIHGAAVAGSDVRLAVDGACADGTEVTLVEDLITLDASGYGSAFVNVPCSTEFEVRVVESGDGAETGATEKGYGLANRMPVFQTGFGAALPPSVQNPEFVAAGSRGFAIGAGSDIFWQAGDLETPPHRVASMPVELTGLQGAHIDADGILDLAAWGGNVAFLLRGLDRGGYTWAGGWRVDEGLEITGVSMQDLDADRYADLAVSVTDGLDGWVEILFGDGSWDWETTDVLEVDFPAAGVTAIDENKDGWADVTVLDGNAGFVRRYTQFEDGWLEGGPPEFIDPNGFYVAPEGSRLLPMTDLNHDGNPDVIVNESPGAGNHQLVFFVISETGVVLYTRAYTVYYTTVADMNQDGAADILALEDNVLHIIRDDLVLGDFLSQGVNNVGLAAPLTAAFIDSDEIHDIAIVGDHANVYRGTLVPDDKTEEPVWESVEWLWRSYTAGLTGPHVVSDTNANGLADLVGFTENASNTTVVRNWTFSLDGDNVPQLSSNGSLSFTAADSLNTHGMVQCGDNFFALVSDDKKTGELMRFRVDASGPGSAVRIPVNGTLLACGDFAKSGAVVVGAEAGAWSMFDVGLTLVDAGDVGSAGGLAAADLDGDGVDEVVACETAPCDIAADDLDNDGIDEVVRSSSDALEIEGWGTTRALSGVGEISIADLDDDGFKDVVVADDITGQVLVFRGVHGGISPAVAYHTDEEFHGTASGFDISGDGLPELIIEGAGGTVVHSDKSIPDALLKK